MRQLNQMKLVKEIPWLSIYQSLEPFSIEIFKLKLEAEGIPVRVWDERDSSYNAFGYVHLQVKSEFKDQAKAIIDSLNE
jgi:RNase H-fold protein (predicted Holliday junction resolvase)